MTALPTLFALSFLACWEDDGPQAPTVLIESPPDGAQVTEGHGVELLARVGDGDDLPETLVVDWSVDGEAVCAGLTPLPDGSSSCLWVAVLGGGHVLVEVADPSGQSASAELWLDVLAVNQPPTCTIASPESGTAIAATDTVTFQGIVEDPEDGALQVVVSSSIDAELGTPDPDEQGVVALELGPLSVGEHLITLAATDPGGASCSAEIQLEVLGEDTGLADTGDPAPDTGDPA
jgi:hypothetical protein